MDRHLMHVGGKWVESVSGRWLQVEDPATGQVFAEVPDGTAEDASAAVEAARAAFDSGPWPRLAPEERRAKLLELHGVLVGQMDELVQTTIRDTGATARVAAGMQVGGALAMLPPLAETALLLGSTSLGVMDQPCLGHGELVREPVGVCTAFTPFNFPLFLGVTKIAGAIAMGNTVVIKPSPLAPLPVIALVRACEEAGIPPGVVNVVTGGADPGEVLASHPSVDKVSFTGSTAVGRRIMELAAPTVKRLTLELGGKAPVVILDDADLDLALRGALFSAFVHSGQVCICGTRLLIPESRYDEVCSRLVELVAPIRVGLPSDPATDMGPLISANQRDRVEEAVAGAVRDGATVLAGGRRPDGLEQGYFYEPTILIGVDPEMDVAQMEIFGPVLPVIGYETDDDAVSIANDVEYGLAASVWSGDLARGRAVARRIQAGTVWVNDWGVSVPGAPVGGIKQSGFGFELGELGAFEYTQLRYIHCALDQDYRRRFYGIVCPSWA
jgi:aldehyde dehydrogenase (NAD+)